MSDLIESEREKRDRLCQQVKESASINLGKLKYWNYEPCAAHETPQADCEFRACGGDLFTHQKIGVTWLYLRKKGLLADLPGVGKTNQTLGLAALLKERGELTERMLIVCQTPAVLQWLAEAQRWVPKLRVDAVYSGMSRASRIQHYVQDWDVMIIGYHMLLRDWEALERYEIKTMAIDDVDPLLNHETATHEAIMAMAKNMDRCIVMNATSIQTKLEQLHAALLPAGGFEVFGSRTAFERRHIRTEIHQDVTKSGRVVTKREVVGYRNGAELRRKLAPMVLRRRYEDLHDIKMPTLMPPEHVWFDLHPAQAKKYKELQQGVLRLKMEDGAEKVKHAAALAKVTYGQQICAGLPALGEADGKEASVKLDWLMKQITETWTDRKVVCFIKNLGMVEAAQRRLDNLGVGYATIWGRESSPIAREQEKARFWSDPNCRVFLGTSAIERALNLQVANILVNVDTMLNPARMQQIAGRVRRAGSQHQHIWIFNLFVRNTQEERYLDVLQKRQAVADYTWGESNDLYEALTPMELLSLITP